MPEQQNNSAAFLYEASLLETIRQRPAMYVGQKSISALYHFVQGVIFARMAYGIKAPSDIPPDFAAWVGYRLHLQSEWSGFWHHAISSKVKDESLAVDKFYELLDEYYQREEKIIATIHSDHRAYKIGHINAQGDYSETNELFPTSLRIVVYTADPGLFLVADEPFIGPFPFVKGFLPGLDDDELPFLQRFQVQDEITWKRILDQNKRYKRNLERRRARIRQKELQNQKDANHKSRANRQPSR